ncbi:hypothetical protein RB601_004337, partial [Gaeumannomyces tritici]
IPARLCRGPVLLHGSQSKLSFRYKEPPLQPLPLRLPHRQTTTTATLSKALSSSAEMHDAISPTIYPDWPRSDADLVPLPRCEGPKLKAFDFGGPQRIEFLQLLGDGAHGIVFKVKMRHRHYALKLFRFCYEDEWPCMIRESNIDDRAALTAFAQHSEPFYAECRAFARLQETGHQDLALACFGYVLLDETHEALLLEHFPDTQLIGTGFSATFKEADCPPGCNVRTRYPGRDGRAPPIRGIVKELAEEVPERDLNEALATRMLADIGKFQQLGIFRIDVTPRQLLGNKTVSDLSMACTIPHWMATRALNPNLTPALLEAMRLETFIRAKADYLQFDYEIDCWNDRHGATEGAIELRAFPGGQGAPKLRSYELRNKEARERVYTHVNPTSYDWRRKSSASKRPLCAKPRKWIYCFGKDPELAEELRSSNPDAGRYIFEYKNGYIQPWM